MFCSPLEDGFSHFIQGKRKAFCGERLLLLTRRAGEKPQVPLSILLGERWLRRRQTLRSTRPAVKRLLTSFSLLSLTNQELNKELSVYLFSDLWKIWQQDGGGGGLRSKLGNSLLGPLSWVILTYWP